MLELKDKKLKFVQMPPFSPDLNPIENFFAVLKGKLAHYSEILDLSDRIANVIEYDIKQGYVNDLIDSMPKRLEEVVKAKGEINHYWIY